MLYFKNLTANLLWRDYLELNLREIGEALGGCDSMYVQGQNVGPCQ